MSLDHSQVSELLAAYVSDELSADQAADVRAHLDGCDTCRAELAGVMALASLPDEHLEPNERVALRDAVRARVEKKSWSRRLAPALGAVGLVAIVVVGAATILDNGMSGDDVAVTAEDEQDGDRTAESQAKAAPGSGRDVAAGQAGGGGVATEDSAGTTSETNALFSAALAFADAPPLTPDLLSVLDTARLSNAPRARLGSLLRMAPDDRWADQMIACTERVGTFLPRDARAAYAAVYPDDGLLVMGFLWSENGTQRYAFWGWPAGDCSTITPIYSSGTI